MPYRAETVGLPWGVATEAKSAKRSCGSLDAGNPRFLPAVSVWFMGATLLGEPLIEGVPQLVEPGRLLGSVNGIPNT